MPVKTRTYITLIGCLAILFCSCVSQRKVTALKKDLTAVNTQLQQHEATIKSLDEQRKGKQDLNEIDDTASSRFQKFITSTNSEIEILISENTVLVGETVVSRADWDRLNSSFARSQAASKKINEKVMLLTDLINRNTVIRLDQDLLFEPGQYTVTTNVSSMIGKFFEPAAKEIDVFVKKYPDFPLSLIIMAKGYADATPIQEGSTLYKNLLARMTLNPANPDSKALNKELSEARAEEVIKLFKKFTIDRSGNKIGNISYLFEGKGETYPNPKATDYKVNDSRRRIVLLFWSVFPDM
ncbi:MAG TPA: hypothetical protein VLJ68_08725 [Chitinophagaceae bacterium]|nr:hypothetical protein [Chitinophagaceae bacterium]